VQWACRCWLSVCRSAWHQRWLTDQRQGARLTTATFTKFSEPARLRTVCGWLATAGNARDHRRSFTAHRRLAPKASAGTPYTRSAQSR
jgi:hypothetical protein